MQTFSNKNRCATALRLIGWLLVLGLIVLSLIQLPPTPQVIPNSDKLLHLSTYFGLSYWFLHTYHKYPLQVIIGFILLGLGLEILQFTTPFRFFEWLDLLMNTTGVLLAFVVFAGFKIKIKWLLQG